MPPPGYPYPPPPRSRSRSVRRQPWEASKYTCRFFIGIENDDEFRVARRIIGANGAKMKDIVSKSGGDAKLRLRGKGSGFVERDTNSESNEPLQLCISCPRQEGYNIAAQMVEELLLRVYSEYDSWCLEHGIPHRAPAIRKTERHHVGERGGSEPPPRRRGGRTRKTKAAAAAPSRAASADRGEPPPGAPPVDEIKKLISDRNDARRKGDFERADEIREDLRSKGVVLSDEKGGHGSGLMVTSWRYWHD